MKVEILQGIDGAKCARGVVVIIDVFRAFTVEAYAFRNHAQCVIPVKDVDFAYAYKKEHPDVVLIGERNGKILPGFDYGNSPSAIENVDFTGKIVVHTTSAGTQGIANAVHADRILGGSLVTADALVRYIQKQQFSVVSLVCMGLNGVLETEEDTLCAKYIQEALNGNCMDISKEIAALRYTSGAKFFDVQQTDFPEEDFALCTQLKMFDFVLELQEGALPYMKRIVI